MRLKSNVRWMDLPGVECAYQSIGAPSAVDALLNVGHDHRMVGKYSATPGVAPTWSSATGWMGNGTQYLKTGVIASSTNWSIIVTFRNRQAGETSLFGSYGPPTLIFERYLGLDYFGNGAWSLARSLAVANGVAGISGKQTYFNGVFEVGIGAGNTVSGLETYLFCENRAGPFQICTVQIPSVLIVSRILSPAEMWLASRQMQFCEQNPDWNAWSRRRQYFYAPSAAFNAAWAARTNRLVGGGLS